ncbi:MAG: hypothetical protein ABI837_05945 [Acidobacteriota bacterium]
MQLTDHDDKDLELSLAKVSSGSRGRVLTASPLVAGRIAWVSENGIILEEVTLAEDGSFQASTAHADGSPIVVRSANQPLQVLRQPGMADGDQLLLRLPTPAPQTIAVHANESWRDRDSIILVRLNGVIIPPDLLTDHEAHRGIGTVISRGQSVVLADIASAPAEVSLLPLETYLNSRRASGGVNLLSAYEYKPVRKGVVDFP